jgi:hypothetical protein
MMMNEEKKYIVKWKSIITDRKGEGKPVDYSTAQLLAEEGNKTFRDLFHWVEEAPLQK